MFFFDISYFYVMFQCIYVTFYIQQIELLVAKTMSPVTNH